MRSHTKERGAPRRGPYGGKTRSFGTKLTDQTMDRLEKRADATNMSVSQAAEAVLVTGLDAQDDFQRHFDPPLRAFEAYMTRTMPRHDGTDDLSDWSDAAGHLVARLSEQLGHSIAALRAELDPTRGKTGSAKKAKPTGRRVIDLD
jgi:hypothetical protein